MTQDKNGIFKACVAINKKFLVIVILIEILVPGWSGAGPWLNLSKNFGGLNFFLKPVGPTHITKRKIKKENNYDQK